MEIIGQPAENINSTDDNPNLEDKMGLVHIEMLAADMEYDLLLMGAVQAVEYFCLEQHQRARPIVSLTFYILTWDTYYIG